MLIVPLLLIQGGSDAAASGDGGTTSHQVSAGAAVAGAAAAVAVNVSDGTRGSAYPITGTVSTTTPPTTSPVPVETTLPTQNVASHVLVAPTTTTTTAPPPPPTTTTTAPPLAAAPVGGSVHYGQVTYYDHPAGRCASPFLPFGTVVRITNPANGLSVTCTVDDREADTARSIDLATSTFALLAPLSQGVVDAELTW